MAYGNLVYSSDSSICLSAFHAGTIPAEGGDVMLHIKMGIPEYESENLNGVHSRSRAGNIEGLAFSLEKVPDPK
jgi:hypothetical protein